ncbi:solute carrier family 2, facilitated glucose transporter member 10 [Chanos chanos]|uniref:Solute carrier family 2, facilitated glucose transporter member 10 n=1 Tax=Chanos chanos TaxID=29144 RepID=A0A6J2VSD6_CHACN|nr:solute carrier family 2, facilitated glucose transporter member 10 [Chanos chanos]
MGCPVMVLATVASTLGGLVFGYELGIISGALLQLEAELHLGCVQQEAVVSALLIGAVFASVVGGWLIDHHGRRNSILLSNLLILGGSLVLTFSGSFLALVGGRITVGFAMCISSMSCCIFVSELVTPQRRGLMVTLYEGGITLGILSAYAINYFLSDVQEGWKYMFGLAIVPSILQFVSICLLPSNTAMSYGHVLEHQRQGGLVDGTNVEDEVLNQNRTDDKKYSFFYLFQRKDNMQVRTLIGLGLVLFQQFTGQPNVLFYASTIFHSVGFHSDASAVLASVGLGVVKVIATLVSMICADKVGRKPLLIGGCVVMAGGLMLIGLLSGHSVLDAKKPCSSLDPPMNSSSATDLKPWLDNHVNQTLTGQDTDDAPHRLHAVPTSYLVSTVTPSTEGHNQRIIKWFILISMLAVVSAFSVGFGPMTWLVLSEIFPAGVRGRAFAFTSCFNWVANLIVTFTFLNVIDSIGLSGTFFLYGVMGIAAVVFIVFMLPETKGKSLQEIDRELCEKRSVKIRDFTEMISAVFISEP